MLVTIGSGEMDFDFITWNGEAVDSYGLKKNCP